jgi:hypothetical protein
MLSLLGVEWQKTVAAYCPSHNGRIERFVGTAGQALRALSEKNQQAWVDWIPFVEHAYNTRIHSSTGVSPYECMFGIKCNEFGNSQNEEHPAAMSESEKIVFQAEIMKKLTDIRQEVQKRSREAAEKQKDTQNKRTKRILRTFLPNGTIVYRKNEGMITKLSPRWIGPYKVYDHDERGNYLLLDNMNVGVDQKYPLEKLVVLDQSQQDEETGEVKAILNDRTRENAIEYLVQWANGDSDSWVCERDFHQVDIINAYWHSKLTGVPEPRKRGRPPRINS